MPTLQEQIRDYLEAHPDVREALELVRITEEEYARCLMAYQVPAGPSVSVGSTIDQVPDVHVPGTRRQASTTARTA